MRMCETDSVITRPSFFNFSQRYWGSTASSLEVFVRSPDFSNRRVFGRSNLSGKSRVLFCAVLLSLVSCTPQQHSVSPVKEKAAVPAGDPFAVAVSRMTPGQQAVMSTPYGADSLVTLENVYTSGLGLSCRKAQVAAGGASHRLAICRDDSGWYVSDPIFEQSQR